MIGKGPVHRVGLVAEDSDRLVERSDPQDAVADHRHRLGRRTRRIKRDDLAGGEHRRARWRDGKAADILQRSGFRQDPPGGVSAVAPNRPVKMNVRRPIPRMFNPFPSL